MPILTEEMQKKYVYNKVKHCPFCNNIFFHEGNFSECAEGVYRSLVCDNCGESFDEIYMLAAITKDD